MCLVLSTFPAEFLLSKSYSPVCTNTVDLQKQPCKTLMFWKSRLSLSHGHWVSLAGFPYSPWEAKAWNKLKWPHHVEEDFVVLSEMSAGLKVITLSFHFFPLCDCGATSLAQVTTMGMCSLFKSSMSSSRSTQAVPKLSLHNMFKQS